MSQRDEQIDELRHYADRLEAELARIATLPPAFAPAIVVGRELLHKARRRIAHFDDHETLRAAAQAARAHVEELVVAFNQAADDGADDDDMRERFAAIEVAKARALSATRTYNLAVGQERDTREGMPRKFVEAVEHGAKQATSDAHVLKALETPPALVTNGRFPLATIAGYALAREKGEHEAVTFRWPNEAMRQGARAAYAELHAAQLERALAAVATVNSAPEEAA